MLHRRTSRAFARSPLRGRTAVRWLAAAVVGVTILTASPAAAFRLRGVALDDRGPYVTLVFRVRVVGNSLVGRVRCIAGSARCLFGRAAVSAVFASNGSFTGSLLSGNRRTQCNVGGVLTTAGLEGRYACARDDGAGSVGSFLVTQ